MNLRQPLPLCLALLGLVAVAALAALALGPLEIAPLRVLASLGLPVGVTPEDYERTTVLHIRLPRLVLALLVGAALAQAGAAMQGVFRNPLADPGLAGISSGAALAASTVIVLGGLSGLGLHSAALPVAAFAGAAGAAWCVSRMAQVNGYTRVGTLLLAGLAVNAVAGAGLGFLSYVADDVALRSLTFWMFGSLGKAGWGEILVFGGLLLVPVLLLPRDARALNAMLLGEAEAGHLGVDVERLKRRLMLLVLLAVASSVALAGIIGFIGLVVPHILRLWAGPDHRLLLPASALLGAALLVLADLGARLMLAPAELPVGILTALIGGPFFLALLLRNRGSAEML